MYVWKPMKYDSLGTFFYFKENHLISTTSLAQSWGELHERKQRSLPGCLSLSDNRIKLGFSSQLQQLRQRWMAKVSWLLWLLSLWEISSNSYYYNQGGSPADQWRGLFLLYLRLTILFPLTLLQVSWHLFVLFLFSCTNICVWKHTVSGLFAHAK